MHVDLSHQTDALQGVLQDQDVGIVGVMRSRGLRNQLVLLGNLPQNARLQFLVLEQGSDDDALLGAVLLQLGQLLDGMFGSYR